MLLIRTTPTPVEDAVRSSYDVKLLGGSGAPSDDVGYDGDFYLDEDAPALYGPKANGQWGEGTGLTGPPGDKGDEGDAAPAVLIQYSEDGMTLWHNTPTGSDQYVRFSTDDGATWGSAASFKGPQGIPGEDAPALKIQYSADDISYHATFTAGDLYQRVSVDNGVTWGSGMKFVGEDGTGGGADEATINSLIFAMR